MTHLVTKSEWSIATLLVLVCQQTRWLTKQSRPPQVVILYVDEEESVRRQMLDAGTGDIWELRATDVNEALCRRRYQASASSTACSTCATTEFPTSATQTPVRPTNAHPHALRVASQPREIIIRS